MRKFTLIAAAALTLSGCMGSATFTPANAPKATVEELLTDVRYSLKDPAAAQFRNVRTYGDGTGTYVVCGMVNGKNSFGGYTGFQPFRASVDASGRVFGPYINDYLAIAAPCS